MGADRFLELQKQILEDYRFKPLPQEDLIRLIEEAGAENAVEFFRAWKKGDVRIGADVSAITDSTVRIDRTGNVPYPIDVEVVAGSGVSWRFTVPMDSNRQTFRVGKAVSVLLDPDGVVPMWNSNHPGMQALFIDAMYRANLTRPFITSAKTYLAEHPDNSKIRYTLSRQLFMLARYSEGEEKQSTGWKPFEMRLPGSSFYPVGIQRWSSFGFSPEFR